MLLLHFTVGCCSFLHIWVIITGSGSIGEIDSSYGHIVITVTFMSVVVTATVAVKVSLTAVRRKGGGRVHTGA